MTAPTLDEAFPDVQAVSGRLRIRLAAGFCVTERVPTLRATSGLWDASTDQCVLGSAEALMLASRIAKENRHSKGLWDFT
jgi:hypothetical protein